MGTILFPKTLSLMTLYNCVTVIGIMSSDFAPLYFLNTMGGSRVVKAWRSSFSEGLVSREGLMTDVDTVEGLAKLCPASDNMLLNFARERPHRVGLGLEIGSKCFFWRAISTATSQSWCELLGILCICRTEGYRRENRNEAQIRRGWDWISTSMACFRWRIFWRRRRRFHERCLCRKINVRRMRRRFGKWLWCHLISMSFLKNTAFAGLEWYRNTLLLDRGWREVICWTDKMSRKPCIDIQSEIAVCDEYGFSQLLTQSIKTDKMNKAYLMKKHKLIATWQAKWIRRIWTTKMLKLVSFQTEFINNCKSNAFCCDVNTKLAMTKIRCG